MAEWPPTQPHFEPSILYRGRSEVRILDADLAALRARLGAAGVEIVTDDADIGVERCYVADPFGNRIELVAAKDGGFTERPRPSSDAR